MKPIVFTGHALRRMRERGAREEDVRQAIRAGERESAQRGLILYRLSLEFKREWDGRYYAVQQVVPIVAEELIGLSLSLFTHFTFRREEQDEDNLRQGGRRPLHSLD